MYIELPWFVFERDIYCFRRKSRVSKPIGYRFGFGFATPAGKRILSEAIDSFNFTDRQLLHVTFFIRTDVYYVRIGGGPITDYLTRRV